MSFLIRFPENFVPEEHGWELTVPEGDAPAVWLRWEIPFKYPASLARCLYDEASGAVGGWYGRPVEGEPGEQATLRQLHAEILGE